MIPTSVYIACSLDGYIADRDNSLEWLFSIPNPQGGDFGYAQFIAGVDGILMGRRTFAFVEPLEQWPYAKPVFVASTTLDRVPPRLESKVTLVSGTPADLLAAVEQAGVGSVYLDGGTLITKFLEADLVDRMTVTRTSQLLGDGYPLFGKMARGSIWKRVEVKELNADLVQTVYERDRRYSAGTICYG